MSRRRSWAFVALASVVGLAVLPQCTTKETAPSPVRSDPTSPKARSDCPIVVPDVAPEKTGEILILGKVMAREGEVGKPIVGASVFLDGATRAVSRTETDEDGLFQLPVDLSVLTAVRVEAPGFAGAEKKRAALLREHDRIPFYLTPGVAVDGQVVAEDRPVDGAWVRCVRASTYASPEWGASVSTDAEGGFSVMCPGQRAKVVAGHEDYQRAATDWLDPGAQRPGDPVRLELRPGTRLHGKVLDRCGSPVPQVYVSVDPTDETRAMHAWRESSVILPEHTRTGPQGQFDFGVVSGRLRVSASRGYGASSHQDVELQGRERFLELTMDPGVTVSGRVTLAGEPAAKVMVGWSCTPGSASVRLTSKAGEFLFEQVKDGKDCAVVARPAGEHYLWNRSDAIGGFASTQMPARAGDQGVELALARENLGSLEISFDGKSADYHGDFSLVPLGEIENSTPVREVKSFARASTVSVGGLRAGRYRLEADLDDGMDPQPVVVEIDPGQQSKVTLTVPQGMARGTASGRLIDSNTGRPLGGITVWYSSGEHSATALQTKSDGTFQFEYAAERTGIHVTAEGYEPFSLEVAVGQGKSAELGNLELVRKP